MYNSKTQLFDIYVQMRPSRAHWASAWRELNALVQKHQAAYVELAGIAASETRVGATFCITMEAPKEMNTPESAKAGFDFVQDLFSMQDLNPFYVSEPSEWEREAAEKFMANASKVAA